MDDFVKDPETGEVTEILCTYYPESRSGNDTSGIKAKGTLHWVSVEHAISAEVRLYDRLFKDENPLGHEGVDFIDFINEDSLTVVENAMCEPSLASAVPGDHFQFLRLGYFAVDPDTTPEKPIFNRTVTLRDTWAKVKNK